MRGTSTLGTPSSRSQERKRSNSFCRPRHIGAPGMRQGERARERVPAPGSAMPPIADVSSIANENSCPLEDSTGAAAPDTSERVVGRSCQQMFCRRRSIDGPGMIHMLAARERFEEAKELCASTKEEQQALEEIAG